MSEQAPKAPDTAQAKIQTKQQETPKAGTTVGFKVLRKLGDKHLPPKLDEDGFTWRLPFAPIHGAEVAVAPNSRQWLRTAIMLNIPKGVIARVSHPIAKGRFGYLVPAVEIDNSLKDAEIEVPLTNIGPQPFFVHPGEYVITLRFERVGAGSIRVEMEEHDEDEDDE